MPKPTNKNENRKRVFFITSNKTFVDNELEYSIIKRDGIDDDHSIVFEISYKYKNRENFTIKIHSFSFIPTQLSKHHFFDKNTYKTFVSLKENNLKEYKAEIYFQKDKNNFIYDLKFKENWLNFQPPIAINFNKKEQLNLYGKFFEKYGITQDNELSTDLVLFTQKKYIFDQNFYLDLFLDLFKLCYKTSSAQRLLFSFKLERVLLPPKIDEEDEKDYSNLLNKIIEDPSQTIVKGVDNKLKKNLIFKGFFTESTPPVIYKISSTKICLQPSGKTL
jgi:hypothetical protein